MVCSTAPGTILHRDAVSAAGRRSKGQLIAEMAASGCTQCHDTKLFEADWFNLETPGVEPYFEGAACQGCRGGGLGLCRDRKVAAGFKRLRIMSTGQYQHAVMPLDQFPSQKWQPWDESGEPIVSFESTDAPGYQNMLAIIRAGRARALASHASTCRRDAYCRKES